MKTIHALGLCLLMWGGTSCVFYAPPVKRADQINKDDAILYGRFTYGEHFTEELNPAWYTAGVWLRNETSDRTHYLELKVTNTVYGVQVEPGSYRITGLVRSENEHRVKARVAFPWTNAPAWLAASFEVRKGEQIYIGDYQCETKLDYPILHTRIKSITNNFAATTVEFRKTCPELMTTPAVSIFDPSFRDR